MVMFIPRGSMSPDPFPKLILDQILHTVVSLLAKAELKYPIGTSVIKKNQ